MSSQDNPTASAGRRQLQQLVAGMTEGIALVEPDRRIVWANAAMLAMHKVKTQAELGATIEEYRKRFALRFRNGHVVKAASYPMAQALEGQLMDDTLVELRVRGEDDPIGIHRVRTLLLEGEGTLYAAIHHDVTAAFQAQERFERTFASNPAPALICRLSDLRVVKVNAGFLEMTGYARDALIGRSLRAIDLFESEDVKKMTSARFADGASIPQTESMVRMAGGALKYVILAGHPLDMGDEPCMLVTFVDLDARRKAEHALRHSEELFSKAFRLAPVPMMVVTREEGRVLDANDAFLQTLNFSTEETLGHTLRELSLWHQPAVLRAFEQDLARAGSVRNQETLIGARGDDVLDCVVSAENVTINERDCTLIVLQDITERKRSETELITAIEAVMQDTSWFSRSVIEKLAHIRHPGRPRASEAALGDLTVREQDVLGALCQGGSDAEISAALGISRNTVRNHISTIYGKIGVNRRAAALVWARERGFTGVKPRVGKK
jgi:PAS domain S-box-containing protein